MSTSLVSQESKAASRNHRYNLISSSICPQSLGSQRQRRANSSERGISNELVESSRPALSQLAILYVVNWREMVWFRACGIIASESTFQRE